MLRVTFISFLLAILAAPVIGVINALFELTPEQCTLLGLFTSIFIYASYYAPNFENHVRLHNENLRKKLEEDLKRQKGEEEQKDE